MSFFEMFGQLGVFALVTVAVAFLPLIVAAVYAAAPSERRLALLRPISLAGIFSALTGLFNGGIAVLRGIAHTRVLDREAWSAIAVGGAETLIPVFVGFGCLTVAWLLVAFGMRRSGDPGI